MIRTVAHSSHWGAFSAHVEEDRIVSVTPFHADKDPSDILQAIPEMVHSEARVARPSIRRGWLEGGTGRQRERRGTDEFIAVPWDEAIDLVVSELSRVRTEYGNEALFTGSYGWSSAGRFHHAKSHLLRFMNLFGGSTRQINSYSFAAAQVLIPRIVGSMDIVTGPMSSWDGIVQSTELMVCFGGIPMKNAQIESGGLGAHTLKDWLVRSRGKGLSFVNVSPIKQDMADYVDADWLPIRPNTDTALMFALSYVLLTEELHDRAFLASHCVGFDKFEKYLRGKSDGIAKTPGWASGITTIPAERIVALARKMAKSRSMINVAWALQRADHGEQPLWAAITLAAMLGQIGLLGGGIGIGYGAENGLGNPRPPSAIQHCRSVRIRSGALFLSHASPICC